MKHIFILLSLLISKGYTQISMDSAEAVIRRIEIGSYSYHEQFKGHAGYAAPVILTSDGGAAAFGDYEDKTGRGAMLVKLNSQGVEEWSQMIRPEFDELEAQSVLEDQGGNYFVFMLSYNYNKYRGGSERVVYISEDGIILWDKTFGDYDLVNNPTFSYIHLLNDNRVELRGHIVTEKSEEGKDPEYHYWEGWVDPANGGSFTQKIGDVIDWSKKDWEKRLKPE